MSEDGIEYQEDGEKTVSKSNSKRGSRIKQPDKPEAEPVIERQNPIPGAPEIENKYPGDDGYRYGTAYEMIAERVLDLEAEIKELIALRKKIATLQPAPPVLDPALVWESQQAIQRRLKAEADERKLKVRAVLKEMDLL